jgi:hypothetical protein
MNVCSNHDYIHIDINILISVQMNMLPADAVLGGYAIHAALNSLLWLANETGFGCIPNLANLVLVICAWRIKIGLQRACLTNKTDFMYSV